MGLNQEIVQDLMISIHTILTLLELQTKEYKQEAQCAQKGADASFCHLWLYQGCCTKFSSHIANLSYQKL